MMILTVCAIPLVVLLRASKRPVDDAPVVLE
jgi:hypothetical protein